MKETLPSYEAMMPAVLKVLSDGVARPLREVFERVCQHYAFTPEQLADTLPSGRQTTLRSRVGWAKTYLVKAGLIEQPKRGLCLITERGNAALVSGPIQRVRYVLQANHLFASIVAVTKLEVLKIRTKLNHFALRAKLYLKATRIAFDELRVLRAQPGAGFREDHERGHAGTKKRRAGAI